MFTANNNNRSNMTLYNMNNTINKNNTNDVNFVNPVMPFSRKYQMFKVRQNVTEKTSVTNSKNIELATPEKPIGMKWGKSIWTLFHTLAEKITDESFTVIGKDLINIIIKICSNLPCPTCSEHAMNYISKNRFSSAYIQTREQFRTELFKFHNSVNRDKGYPQFQMDKLTETYSELDTIAVVRDFLTVFKDKHFSIRMIANDFHKTRISTQLTSWFNNNITYFV